MIKQRFANKKSHSIYRKWQCGSHCKLKKKCVVCTRRRRARWTSHALHIYLYVYRYNWMSRFGASKLSIDTYLSDCSFSLLPSLAASLSSATFICLLTACHKLNKPKLIDCGRRNRNQNRTQCKEWEKRAEKQHKKRHFIEWVGLKNAAVTL